MFVCDQVVTNFDVERTLGTSSIKAYQSPPFMIIAEGKKTKQKTKENKTKQQSMRSST